MASSTADGQIWLIGGTQESAQLASTIAQANLSCIISVTTEAARSLYSDAFRANCDSPQIQVGKFNVEQLPHFLRSQQIQAVLDASHPYAVEISKLAIAASAKLDIPYLRYERPMLETLTEGKQDAPGQNPPALILLPDIEALLTGDYLQGQRVLLTVGYRSLRLFQPWQNRATLSARILPSVTALEAALAAGFTSDRLVAIRPPVSIELERALWQQWQISLVVTKASGIPGGEDVKRQLAAELGVSLVTIARPSLAYPSQTSDLTVALEFCHQVMQGRFSEAASH